MPRNLKEDINEGLIRMEYLILLKARHNELYLDCIKLYLEYQEDRDDAKLRRLQSNWKVLKDHRYKIDRHIQQDKRIYGIPDEPNGFSIATNFMKLFAEAPPKIELVSESDDIYNKQDGTLL
jgi:hypothetical protein